MDYRALGRTGLRISRVSLGGWLTYGGAVDEDRTRAVVRRALDLGVNHLDTADAYAQGACERALGAALDGVRRSSVVLASKVYWPTGPGPNDRGLSRKHVLESCAASLERLKTPYVDLYYCHRYDPEVPLEETVTAMEDLVARGLVHHWGVSCWTPEQIRAACATARRYKPVVDQPPYNVFERNIENGVLAACAAEGLGVVVWSPLAQGVLTGKYLAGRPAGSRAADEKNNRFVLAYLKPDFEAVVRRWVDLAARAGCTAGQLALAWCLRRPEVTSVIVGATAPVQLEETTALPALPTAILAEAEAIASAAPLHHAV